MAGDWIKFEIATSDKHEVWSIADKLSLDPDAVVGKLLRVWTWFDQHTEEGNAPTVTKKLLDRLVSVSGFCDSMIDADWMIESEGFISLPNFDHHNGKTAKNRAVTAKRVAKHKKSNAKVTDEVTQEPLPSALPKEEKRREEKNSKNKRFVQPTLDEVKKYCDERKNTINPSNFIDHYTTNGWVQASGQKIKCWKACVRTWESNQKKFGGENGRSNKQFNKPDGHSGFKEIDYKQGTEGFAKDLPANF